MIFLQQLLQVFVIGCRHYPTLAAVHMDTAFALVCASFYAFVDFAITIIRGSLCRNEFYLSNKNYSPLESLETVKFLTYYGTGGKLILFQLIMDFPRYLFQAYICIQLIRLFIDRMMENRKNSEYLSPEKRYLLYFSTPNSPESKYVRKLFIKTQEVQSTNRQETFFKFIYTFRDDFRFSSRILCVYSTVFLILFFLTVQVKYFHVSIKTCNIFPFDLFHLRLWFEFHRYYQI